MIFGDLPGRMLLPTIIPVAVVLIIASFGIWVALHSRGKPLEEVPDSPPAPSSALPVDQKEEV